MKEMKVFDIDGIKVSIPMDMYKEAIRVYALEERYGDYICLSQMILAGFRETLNDLERITLEWIKNNHTEEEISERAQEVLIDKIKLYGGNYDIT